MTKPFLFLDIDGVLNSFGGLDVWGDDEEHWIAPSIGGGREFLITCSKSMGEAINSLDCEIWWTTTWQKDAWMVGDLIGVQGEVLDLDAQPGWKRAAVERKLQEDTRPFLWFEDDDSAHGSFNSRGFKNFPPHRLFNTNPYLGITPENIEIAREFLDGLKNNHLMPVAEIINGRGRKQAVQPMPQPALAELDDDF